MKAFSTLVIGKIFSLLSLTCFVVDQIPRNNPPTAPIYKTSQPMLSTSACTQNTRLDYRSNSDAQASMQPIKSEPEQLNTDVVHVRKYSSPQHTKRFKVSGLGLMHNYGHYIPTSFTKQPSIHAWELPLCYKAPNGPVETILHGVIQTQRELAREGLNETALAGPLNPSVNLLVAPERFNSSQVHPVARILTEMLSKMTYRSLIDKLGALIVMYPIYQWQIATSYASYANIPSWCRPVLCQRTTPHPVWIGALGPPLFREAVIANQERYCTEEFPYLCAVSLNMNWPHGLREALIWNGKDFRFRKEFWDHAQLMENWSLDEPFQSRYPELEPFVQFTKYPKCR